MPLLRRVAFCQKGVSSQTFVKKLREIFYYPGAGRAGLEFSKCPASGLRIKTEIKGFPRSRTQTVAAAGPKFSKCPASGLRIKTEIKGFPRNRTQTGGARRACRRSVGGPLAQKKLLRISGTAFFLLELLKWLITEREP